VNSQLEEDEVGAVIMNRWAVVNGYLYFYPYPWSSVPLPVPAWGTPGGIASIVQAPGQFAVWNGDSLTTSAQNNLDAALDSAAGSKQCADLVNAIGSAITYAGAEGGVLYTDAATGLVPLAFNSNNTQVPKYMKRIGDLGDGNVFYGAPVSDFSQTIRPKRPRRPPSHHTRSRAGGAILVQ
jgi:hypothetical protein